MAKRDANQAKPAPPPSTGAGVMARQLRIGFLLHDVSRLRRKFYDQEMRRFGITRSQWVALVILTRDGAGGITQTEFAKGMEIGKAAAGGIIDRLEVNGYVRRVADQQDRRINRVYVSDKGRQVLDLLSGKGQVLNDLILQGIPDHHVQLAEDVLAKMKENIQAAIGGLDDDGEDGPLPD